MRLPWRKSRNAAKAAAQPRDEMNRFMAPQKESTAKAVETEARSISTVVEVVKGIHELARLEDARAVEKAEALMVNEGGVEVGNEWIPVVNMALQIFGPAITPYVPSVMERLGFTASGGVPPSEAPPSPSSGPAAAASSTAAGQGIIPWINRAAEASPNLIKPFIPKLLEEVEKQGIDPVKFKQAIRNISKAI